MVSGGMACVKYLLFLFNLIFAITGVVFTVVGSYILIHYKGYSNFMSMWMFAVPLLMIVVGVVVFLTSFFGCCGAVKENHCMIITFSVLLFAIFAFEVGTVISSYMMSGKISFMLEDYMNKTMVDYKRNDDYRKTWDYTQRELKCCGVTKPSDWMRAGMGKNELPVSCCSETPANAPEKCDANEVLAFDTGCKQKLQEVIEEKALLLGAVGIGVALIQLIGVIFACCLARSIRREYETVETTAH